MLEEINATLVGCSPLIMHNGQLADPFNKWVKELKPLTSKSRKTDEQLLEIRRLEWFGGLYLDQEKNIAIPADNVLALVVDGAKKHKLGPKAKAGVFDVKPFYRLEY